MARRIVSICIAPVLALAPAFAHATSKTYSFSGWFADQPSVAAGEAALASGAAAKVCPSYGSYSDHFTPFSYTETNFGSWQDYSASSVSFSITCTWQQASYTFSGGWFADASSVQAGENMIEDDLQQSSCGGGKHQIANMHFTPFTYTETTFSWGKDYSASGISGSFTCET